MATREEIEVEIGGRRLSLSNLSKVLYPKAGFTKGQVIDYYTRIAPLLLPHLEGRPLTLKRYPDGVDGFFFYEKNCPSHRPDWIETASVKRRESARASEAIQYCVMDSLPALVWAANLADLELHVPLARADEISCPTAIVFDLDPGPPAGLRECCDVALLVRELFDGMKLESFPKVSGSKGIQVYVPLNSKNVSYEETKPFAKAIAETLEAEHPKLVVSKMKKSLRPGKVLVDWSQNDQSKTTVCVYSLRAKDQPTVSMPVTWKEIEKKDPSKLVFVAGAALARVKKKGDLFEPLLSLVQRLPRG